MTKPYAQEFQARWVDMDFNQHMRNAAFLGCGEETRCRFMADHGFPMEEFMKRRLGPVVLEDRLIYKKELKLLEKFRVELELAGSTADGRRMKLRNRIMRSSDNAVCAIVESVVLWFDLEKRKPTAPPPELYEAWQKLTRTEDFVVME